MIVPDGQEKRLVQEYKITNKQLRRQLENLNVEVDKLIEAKTNRIGLKKLPPVDKTILHTQDIKLLQIQVDNLRKRLEQLNIDNEQLKERCKVNHMLKAKQLEDELAVKQAEKKNIKKESYWQDKNSKNLNTTDIIDEQMKLYDKVEQVNQELLRFKKMQSDLLKEIQERKKIEEKKNNYLETSVEKHNSISKEVNTVLASRVQMPVTHKSSISDEDWKNIKKQFLQLKQSKQRQETKFSEQNQRLRVQIQSLQLRMRQKKYTLQNIRSLQIKRKQRNYSTVQNSAKQNDDGVRYRNKNNAYKYLTKG